MTQDITDRLETDPDFRELVTSMMAEKTSQCVDVEYVEEGESREHWKPLFNFKFKPVGLRAIKPSHWGHRGMIESIMTSDECSITHVAVRMGSDAISEWLGLNNGGDDE